MTAGICTQLSFISVTVMILFGIPVAKAEAGFDPRYERDYNIFNPANRYAPDNPLNPANGYDPTSFLNPSNLYDPGNPTSTT